MPDENNTFGLNTPNSISPEPLSSTESATPATPVAPVAPAPQTDPSVPPSNPTPPLVTPDPALDIDKELEKQLAQTPDVASADKKFPVKIVIIVLAVLLAGGGAAAYFLLGNTSSGTEETASDQPPSIPNPFASTVTEDATETVNPDTTETETPSGPPSLSFPQTAPEEDDAATNLIDTVDTLKETTDAAANATDTPVIDETAPAEDTSQKKISR